MQKNIVTNGIILIIYIYSDKKMDRHFPYNDNKKKLNDKKIDCYFLILS